MNGWYIKNPPWKQWIVDKNNADEFNEDSERVTNICRDMYKLRMMLIPYIYSAFINYHNNGTPPFRALVMDDPKDPNLWNIDDAYMMGDRILTAPVVAGQNERDVYLPKGSWRDFWTGDKYEGGKSYHLSVPLDRILVFVKDDSILPMAEPVMHTGDRSLYKLTMRVYGNGSNGITLYEDDGLTYDYQKGIQNKVDITWDSASGSAEINRTGKYDGVKYEIIASEVFNK